VVVGHIADTRLVSRNIKVQRIRGLLPELFSSALRYTGAGTAYNLGGILGASFAPYIAQRLYTGGGLAWVGGYVSLAAAISLLAVWMMRETHDNSWV